jgi:hypothetical protein
MLAVTPPLYDEIAGSQDRRTFTVLLEVAVRKLVPIPVVPLIAVLLAGACVDTDSRLLAPPEADLSYIGYPGETADVPQSSTTVDHAFAFPSTNAVNIANGWANVTWNAEDAGVEEAPLRFVTSRAFSSCFEYRIDDAEPFYDAGNFNGHIDDGLWQYHCVSSNPEHVEVTLNATSHVDIRLAFGAERDERFDWTRFYVLTLDNKDQCMSGAWQALGFRNQGQCIRYVETGRDARAGQ